MVGEILKKKREESGLDLRECAHKLKIQYEYLKALEENNLRRLPPDVYTRGYIREYARFLGVEPESMVEQFSVQRVAPKEKADPEPVAAENAKKEVSSRRIVSVVLCLAVAGALFAFYSFRGRTDTSAPSSYEVNKKFSKDASVPGQHQEKKQDSVPALPEKASGAASLQRYTLTVRATETTWLSVTLGEGGVEEALMRPGDAKKWESARGFDIKLGNAGGVSLVFNDVDMGIPGESGQVLHITLPQTEQVSAVQ